MDRPLLAYPDFGKSFAVEVDTSKLGLGAILLQESELGQRAVAYASRLCSPTEANYSATEIECVGVIYALHQFRCYVIGREFTFVSDHKALRDLNMLPNPSGRKARWLMILMEFTYTQ